MSFSSSCLLFHLFREGLDGSILSISIEILKNINYYSFLDNYSKYDNLDRITANCQLQNERDTARDHFLTANHSHLECGWELLAIQCDSNLLNLVPLLDHPAHQLLFKSQFSYDHISPGGSGKKEHYIIIGKQSRV